MVYAEKKNDCCDSFNEITPKTWSSGKKTGLESERTRVRAPLVPLEGVFINVSLWIYIFINKQFSFCIFGSQICLYDYCTFRSSNRRHLLTFNLERSSAPENEFLRQESLMLESWSMEAFPETDQLVYGDVLHSVWTVS
ncbi:transmembrane protein, putative [Medicago truncatula]|uniref:Transmembrane protein, putative n=1 Tax=Medicago truncatula TaxID=3880 RepID=A0A072URU8_MEDTR|nr:transmembrane protein, putative [Medicago truncatula]